MRGFVSSAERAENDNESENENDLPGMAHSPFHSRPKSIGHQTPLSECDPHFIP
jgi:hypothetical protein